MRNGRLYLVTITGADEGIALGDLTALSREFPFVEWGLLFSAKRMGTPRYPGREWLLKIPITSPMRFSAHLCGQWARDALAGAPQWPVGSPYFDRVQLNGYEKPSRVLNKMIAGGQQEFILQVRDGSQVFGVAEVAKEAKGNVSALWDPSGGRGVEQALWPDLPRACHWGYAGGIGPDNVCETLDKLSAFPRDFWIDMESGVRTDDAFDLVKVRRVLEAAKPYVTGVDAGRISSEP